MRACAEDQNSLLWGADPPGASYFDQTCSIHRYNVKLCSRARAALPKLPFEFSVPPEARESKSCQTELKPYA